MMMMSFREDGSHCFSNSIYMYLARTLLLLATVLQPCCTDDEWTIQYKQHRIVSSKPGHMHKAIYLYMNIAFPEPLLWRNSSSGSPICLPIGYYRNDTVGYAVCNTDHSHADIDTLVMDTISSNAPSVLMNCYAASDIERSHAWFQCIRFFIRILDHGRGIRVSNLTAIPCPGLSVASLLFPQPYLRRVHIYGLPLHQGPSNVTHICPMSSDLEILDLQNNGLTSTPFYSCPAYFRNLKYVLLENQPLRLNDRPMFTFPGRLIYLSLHRCSLQSLPRSTFDGLIHLQFLNISNNNISSFKKGVFRDLTNLLVLRIDNNGLKTLDLSVFKQQKSLAYLHLRGNYLYSIEGEVAILPSLRVIDLSDNVLTIVRTKLFRNSPKLTLIFLHNNNISYIESEAFVNMTSLRALDVSFNMLTNVNPCRWFDDFIKIEYLLLGFNGITDVDGLQCMSHMKVLNLFANELSAIPPLRNCVNLELLDLGNNAIHNVSGEEFTPATRLSDIYLDVNEMMRLGVLSNSSAIKRLYLDFNNLTYIPAFCFNGLKSLQTLNLTYNQVEYVGEYALPKNLQNLNLRGNELSDLVNITSNFKLYALAADHNNLTKFEIYFSSIVNFDISDNPLKNLSLQLCTKMPRLQNIFLENLGIGREGRVNFDLFGGFGEVCDHWSHVSLAKNFISQIDAYSMLFGVTGGVDYSHNPLKSIPVLHHDIGSVRYLNFANCSIKNIAPMAFQNMAGLSHVGLKGNDIQYFPQMSSSDIEYDLRNNPLVCSCHLRWLHGHPTRSSYLFTNCLDPITGSPEVFDHLPLNRLVCRHKINCAAGCVCFGVNISTVSIVNCSSQSLTSIPLSLSSGADIIYLDHNQFGELYFPGDMEKMAASQLFLQNSEIYFLEQDIFAAFSSLQLIDLSYNELEALNMDVFHSLHDLRKLLLQCNRIHQIYGGADGLDLPNLQIITLHRNSLHAVPESLDFAIRNTPFTNLTLAENPWECTACAGPILRKWLAQHAGIISDAADIRCNKSHQPVLDINTTTLEYAKCVKAIRTLTNTHWGITAGLTVSLVLLLISLVLTYCFRDHFLVLLYNKFDFLKRRRQELDVLYDMRIIYDETDERVRQWVVGELLQVLETEWGHDVFLVERDMLAGGNHAEEIAQSIRQSRRTLIVVSQKFVDNEWAQFAYQAAFQFQIENNLHRVIVVAWEPVETDAMEHSIKVYFQTKQAIRRTSRRFWSVLKSKLPLGKANVCQYPDNIQLNLLHND